MSFVFALVLIPGTSNGDFAFFLKMRAFEFKHNDEFTHVAVKNLMGVMARLISCRIMEKPVTCLALVISPLPFPRSCRD